MEIETDFLSIVVCVKKNAVKEMLSNAKPNFVVENFVGVTL